MKKHLFPTKGPRLIGRNTCLAVLVVLVASAGPATAQPAANGPGGGSTSLKPRIIVTTDLGADPDDEQSLVRLLVSANEFDIEGLIVSTGCWKKNQSNTAMLDRIVDAYGQVLPNLQVHAKGYPSHTYLKSISVLGQTGYGMADVGEGKDSKGSELIIAAADRNDRRPVWAQFWGGGNNLAQAIWKVKHTRSEAELARFLGKLRVFDILGQDDAGAWMAKEFPELFFIRATGVYGWQPPKNGPYQHTDIQSHGPLGAVYPETKWATEGDTPAFMHVYPNGLNDPEKIDQGGWGGRFSLEKKAGVRSMSEVAKINKEAETQYDPYSMYGNTPENAGAIKRWNKGYDNDFAARMDWSVTGKYEDANHHPIAVVNGDSSRQVLEVSAAPGSTVKLDANGSSDPDNHALNYAWSFYREPSSHGGSVKIENSSSSTATVSIPSDAGGKNIHVILELHDNGSPNLYAYRRVIINAPAQKAASAAAPASKSTSKPRVIATTDGEIDDHSSMIRFLLYASDYDVAGIVEVNSKFQKNGHSKEPWLEDQLAAYEQVLPNLRKHNPNYPSAGHLRSVCRVGNENIKDLWVAPPDMETKGTPGEQLIIDTLLDSDPRPVHVLSWGGANTTASALWRLKTERPKAKFDYAVSRIRIYCIWYQDGGGGWIQTNIPGAYINEAYRWDNVWDYESISDSPRKKPCANPPEIQTYMHYQWVSNNVTHGHGPLGALCPQKYVSEGDTPSFLHLVSNGLNAHEDYTLGGWGGRSAYDNPAFPNHITDKALKDDGNRNKMYWRWIPAAQNDFAARMDWCVKEFKDANHAPVAKVKGALVRDVKPGETVTLAATATDPDGNALTCKWWQYADADSATATVTITNSNSLNQASFVAPNEPGKQVHIILEVSDTGTPWLTRYQRVVISVEP